jgi:hypothetical protein
LLSAAASKEAVFEKLVVSTLPLGIPADSAEKKDLLEEASRMVNNETLRLLLRDEYKFPQPVVGKQKKVHRAVPIDVEEVEDEYLEEARSMVAQETSRLAAAHHLLAQDHFGELWEEAYRSLHVLPSQEQEGLVYCEVTGKADMLLSLRTQHAALKAHVERLSKRAGKAANKQQVTTAGYLHRAGQLEAELAGAMEQLRRTESDLLCYREMQRREDVALKQRLVNSRKALKDFEEREAVVQGKYADILRYAKSVGVR